MNYVYPAVGAFCEADGICRFTLWAPNKKNVEILLNGAAIHPLKCDERGYWTIVLNDVRPSTTYFFQTDGKKLYPDPASRWQPQGVHGPSAVVERSFSWRDEAWKGIPLNEMIIYELHVGTFTPQRNFDGVISRLDYLKDLGVNTLELMPVAQFPGNRNWGYDGVYPFAVQDSYGGGIGLKRLVNEAHAREMAVILDVVYNHQGPEGNYLGEYAPFFTNKYHTFWGRAINYDDAYCDGVRHFYWQNALMWLNEFHIDGLRLDAVHAIWDFSAEHFIQGLADRVAALEEQTGRKKVLIAELDLNNPRYIDPPSKGGFGMDGQWVDEFHHSLHALLTGEVNGYYEDFGKTEHLVKSLRDSYVYTGQYSVHRKKLFGVLPADNPYSQFVVFSQNHDQVGNRLLGERLASQLSFEGLKLAAACVLLSPHVPLLFMGEEYGETNPFQYFISHTDKELVELVRKGRSEEFSYFNWQDDVPDPQAEDTFVKCILSFRYEHDGVSALLLSYYRHLINFRKQRAAMKNFERSSVKVFDPQGDVIAFERESGPDCLLILLNFGKQAATYNCSSSDQIKKIFDSSSVEWNGPGEILPAEPDVTHSLQLNPQSAVIFERTK